VVLPPEHGGWSFLAEPLVLGLIAAPSAAGALVAIAAAAAFLARQPLRLLAGDRRRARRYPRTVAAERAFAVLAAIAAAAFAGATALSRGPLWIAAAIAVPIAAAALGFDLARRSRGAAAEGLAALGLGGTAAAIALAAGWPWAPAFGLWGVLAARAIPTVLYVRARLRLERSAPSSPWPALGSAAIAIGGVGWLVALGLAGAPAPWAMALLFARAGWGLSPWRPRWTTFQLGISEAAIGGGLAIGLGVASRGMG
jgi:hypothetical protein